MQQEPPPSNPGPPQGPPPNAQVPLPVTAVQPWGYSPPPGYQPPEPPGPSSERWRPSTALYGILGGFGVAMLLVVIVGGIYLAAGGTQDDPGFIGLMAVLQNVAFVGAAWYFASRHGRPRLSDFGLRRAAPARAIAVAFGIGVIYVALLAIYMQLVSLEEDTVPKDLGADKSTLAMIGFALIAVVLAPLFEELFFRGFLFKAFANGFGVVAGAMVPALYFGILHWDFETTDRLLAVVPLTLLGFLLAMAYYVSGTLYTSIAIHATNNGLAVIAFAATEHSDVGVAVGAGLWLAMMLFCLFGSRFTDRPGPVPADSPPPQGAPPGWGQPGAAQPGWAVPPPPEPHIGYTAPPPAPGPPYPPPPVAYPPPPPPGPVQPPPGPPPE